jgi:hypothetical protein
MENMTPHTPQHDPDQADEVADFDQWREQQRRRRGGGKRVRAFGQLVELPTGMPLGLTLALDHLSGSSDLADIKRIVGQIYGADALDHWIANGVELEDFQVLLTYGIAAANGQAITFERAAELVAEARAKQEVKAQGKARKKGKKRGPGGGSPAAGR